MDKGFKRISLAGVALSALLASGCVTGSSGNDEVIGSGGSGSATSIYDTANGGLASGDSGGPRDPGPGSGVPQPFAPGGSTAGTSTGTTGATGGTTGGTTATTGGGTTGGTSGGSPTSFSGILYIPNGGGGNPFLVALASNRDSGSLSVRSPTPPLR